MRKTTYSQNFITRRFSKNYSYLILLIVIFFSQSQLSAQDINKAPQIESLEIDSQDGYLANDQGVLIDNSIRGLNTNAKIPQIVRDKSYQLRSVTGIDLNGPIQGVISLLVKDTSNSILLIFLMLRIRILCSNLVVFFLMRNLGLMAVCSNIFEWIKQILVKNKVEGVEIQHRTKRVFMQYICVCAKFVRHARKTFFVIFSSKKKYHPLIV